MKLKSLTLFILSCLSFTIAAHANQVVLTVNQPMKVTFQIVHKNYGDQPIISPLQSIDINQNAAVSVDLNNYDLAGLMIVSANGHTLPASVNQFDQAKQCSMATDKTKPTGTLAFTASKHAIDCSTYGGIFG